MFSNEELSEGATLQCGTCCWLRELPCRVALVVGSGSYPAVWHLLLAQGATLQCSTCWLRGLPCRVALVGSGSYPAVWHLCWLRELPCHVALVVGSGSYPAMWHLLLAQGATLPCGTCCWLKELPCRVALAVGSGSYPAVWHLLAQGATLPCGTCCWLRELPCRVVLVVGSRSYPAVWHLLLAQVTPPMFFPSSVPRQAPTPIHKTCTHSDLILNSSSSISSNFLGLHCQTYWSRCRRFQQRITLCTLWERLAP